MPAIGTAEKVPVPFSRLLVENLHFDVPEQPCALVGTERDARPVRARLVVSSFQDLAPVHIDCQLVPHGSERELEETTFIPVREFARPQVLIWATLSDTANSEPAVAIAPGGYGIGVAGTECQAHVHPRFAR